MPIDLGDAFLNFKANLGDLKRGLVSAKGMVGKFSSGVKKAIAVTAKVAAGVGIGIAGGLTVATRAALEFDAAMREVNTLLGLSDSEFKKFKDEVLDMSSAVGIDAVEATGALYQAISAGIPKENVLSFLQSASELAIAGVTDLETSVDVLTSTMNAFGASTDQAEDFADILFTGVKVGKVTIDEFAASVFQVAPIAAAAGIEFETVAAALAAITKQGTPPRIAATQLREAIKALTAATPAAVASMEKYGVEFGQAAIASKGFENVLFDLGEAAGGDLMKIKEMTGSVEAMQAVFALTGKNADNFTESLLAQQERAGANRKAFEEMEEGQSRAFEKIKVKLDNLKIQIGSFGMTIVAAVLGDSGERDQGVSFLDDMIAQTREWNDALNTPAGQEKISELKTAWMTFALNAIDFWSDIAKAVNGAMQVMIEGHEIFFDTLGRMWADNIDQWKRAIGDFFSWYESRTQALLDRTPFGAMAEQLGEGFSVGSAGRNPNPLFQGNQNQSNNAESGFGRNAGAAPGITVNNFINGGNPNDIRRVIDDTLRRADAMPQGAF